MPHWQNVAGPLLDVRSGERRLREANAAGSAYLNPRPTAKKLEQLKLVFLLLATECTRESPFFVVKTTTSQPGTGTSRDLHTLDQTGLLVSCLSQLWSPDPACSTPFVA